MKKTMLLVGISIAILGGCKNEVKKDTDSEENMETVDTTAVDSHNSENSLDWAGVYEGTTPCADCEGIKTTLELKKDNTYVLSQTYLGKFEEDPKEFGESGSFTWKDNGSVVVLKSGDKTIQFKVEENQVRLLDLQGDVIDGDLADMYILKKTAQN
jgi:uncharacterized lipoprotein NlpE involved in copper resistance